MLLSSSIASSIPSLCLLPILSCVSIKFCIVSVLVCVYVRVGCVCVCVCVCAGGVCVCVWGVGVCVCVHAYNSLYRQDFAFYKYFNYYEIGTQGS